MGVIVDVGSGVGTSETTGWFVVTVVTGLLDGVGWFVQPVIRTRKIREIMTSREIFIM
jgi:hypothetical protein